MSRKDKSYAKAIPYLSTYLENGASSNFYIIDYEEGFTFSDTYIPHIPKYIPSRCSLYATPEYILVVE